MPFPDVERVIYDKNPLAEVFCRVEFDPRLELNERWPAGFHEGIRDSYPVMEINPGHDTTTHFPMPTFEFVSKDGFWKVELNATSVTLRTSNYVRWEDFSSRISEVLSSVGQEFGIEEFRSLELVYIDVITRSELGLPNISWGELISDNIFIGRPNPIQSPIIYRHYGMVVEIDEISIGLSTALRLNEEESEEEFVVRTTFASGSLTLSEVLYARLEKAHSYSGKTFRWCISNTLHEALCPQPDGE